MNIDHVCVNIIYVCMCVCIIYLENYLFYF